jgi:hypothetical protein
MFKLFTITTHACCQGCAIAMHCSLACCAASVPYCRTRDEFQAWHADVMALRSANVITSIDAALADKAVGARAGAFLLLTALSEVCKGATEPYLVPLIAKCLDGCADKASEVHTQALRAGRAIINNMNPYGARFVLPQVRKQR